MEKDAKLKELKDKEICLTTSPVFDTPTIRIVVCGKKKCGKSCLIRSYLKKNFTNTKQDTGLNIYAKKMLVDGFYLDFNVENLELEEGEEEKPRKKVVTKIEINVVIIELGQQNLVEGCQLFEEIAKKGAHAFIYCFDIEELKKINFEIDNDETLIVFNNLFQKEKIPVFFCLCKLDLLMPPEESNKQAKMEKNDENDNNDEKEKVIEEDPNKPMTLDMIQIHKDNSLTNFGKSLENFIKNESDSISNLEYRDFFITSSFLHINVDDLFKDVIDYLVYSFLKRCEAHPKEPIFEINPKTNEAKLKIGPEGECVCF